MMNFCQLVVKPPVDAVTGTNDLEIYELNEGFPITAKELTFANRPRRRGSPLALTRAHNGSEWRHSFVCPSDKIFTFEFGCGAGSICDIGWWQTKEPRDTGIFMIQSSVEIA
ncbi:hypothetical protein P691DRAFT_805265 [Macrolepiota fuliginosa MF-IS2]|uniref:Uncharacterized protein n=1 Tax=Macrolepiota fuliginosa MF-IS2 TaxID=1400762 RepID=A0A9P5X9E5_9AGAR|nr:hypothetical protein P691DRAFT_805265 [Macrolepiota fuliginosa MF-IS2]